MEEVKEKSNVAEKQAIFRLGQMDMKISVCDMLRDMASTASGIDTAVRAGLILAADLVETMEESS